MNSKSVTKSWLIMNDLQIPFQDQKALDAIRNFVNTPHVPKFHGLILNGDITDCYSISDYGQNPSRDPSLMPEVRGAQKLMGDFGPLFTEKIWIGGNHEDRLRRYQWKHAPELADHPEMSFPNFFGLPKYGFAWKPYGEHVMLGKLMVTHGDLVSKHSGYSAKLHFEKYGTSVLHGHTHRLGVYYRRDVRGVHAAYENGCLCRLDPEWTQHPNWQQGFSVVHVEPSGLFNVQQIPILPGYRFFYGGGVYGGGK